jgi:hypothetical protein
VEDQRYLRQSSEGFERRLAPAWYDLVERLLHIPALAKEAWTDTMDPREMASRLADRMTMLLDEDPAFLDKACQAAGLAILGDPSPYAMLEYELTPSMGTLDGLPLHTIQVHQDLALLELVTSWQTYVTELPYVTRRVTIEPTPSPGAPSESFVHSHHDAKWAIENKRHEGVVWQGDSLYALEAFWATRTIRLRGGYLAVLGLALAYNYDQGLLVCLDPGNGTYDIAECYDFGHVVGLALSDDSAQGLLDLVAQGDVGLTDYDAMVGLLKSEPGWMPADREHLLGYFCNHERGLIEESKSYANVWEWESAAAPSERPDLIESISPTRPQL